MPDRSPPFPRRALDFLPSEERTTFRSSQGTTHLWAPARGVLVTRVEGVLLMDGALAMITQLEQKARTDGMLVTFHDWEEMTNYEDTARVQLTEVARRMRPQIDSTHILLRSRIVAFGVRLANIVVKYLHVHTERAPFEQALRDTILKKRASTG